MKKFFGEFKTFITRGNVIDMAIGIIIGGAFTAIVTSLVGDVITPLINTLTGKANFSELIVHVGASELMIGNFIQAIINFILTALCLFLLLRAVNRLHKKKEEAPAAPPAPSAEEKLLTEIRDLLAAQNTGKAE